MTNSAGLLCLVFFIFIAIVKLSNNADDLDAYQEAIFECISKEVENKRLLIELCTDMSVTLSEKLNIENKKFISFSFNPEKNQITVHGYSPVAK